MYRKMQTSAPDTTTAVPSNQIQAVESALVEEVFEVFDELCVPLEMLPGVFVEVAVGLEFPDGFAVGVCVIGADVCISELASFIGTLHETKTKQSHETQTHQDKPTRIAVVTFTHFIDSSCVVS